MLDQFGISVSGLSHNHVYDLSELNVDIIQVPLHRGLPDEYVIDQLADADTQICGKLVPDPKLHDAQFFQKLFKRYRGKIKLWDFGGEPETRPHQLGCRWPGAAKEFVSLHQQFWLEAKLTDPENVVGGAGFISPTFNGFFGNESRFDFVEELFSEGFGPSADFLSINTYVYGYGGLKSYIAGVLKFRELMARYQLQEKPLVVAEGGIPCDGDPKFLHIIQTPERQANILVEFHLICCALGIDYSIWYTFRDTAWGILDAQGVRRPAFLAFKNMIRILKGAKFKGAKKALPNGRVQERWLTDKISWYVLENPHGNEVHVVWMSGGSMLERRIPREVLGSCDTLGRALPGSVFTLDESPKYFESTPGALHSGNFLVS